MFSFVFCILFGLQPGDVPTEATTPTVTESAQPVEEFVSITRVRHFLRDLVAANRRSGGSCAECFDLDVPPAEALPKATETKSADAQAVVPTELASAEPPQVPELQPGEIDPYIVAPSGEGAVAAVQPSTAVPPSVSEEKPQTQTAPQTDAQTPQAEPQVAQAPPVSPEVKESEVKPETPVTAPAETTAAAPPETKTSEVAESKPIASKPAESKPAESTRIESQSVESQPASSTTAEAKSVTPARVSELPPTFELAQPGKPAQANQVPTEAPLAAPALLDMDANDAEPIQRVANEEPLNSVTISKPGIVADSNGAGQGVAAQSAPGTAAQDTPGQEAANTTVPPTRPWGVLTFVVFLLMLSISANVFLGWQLWDKKRA